MVNGGYAPLMRLDGGSNKVCFTKIRFIIKASLFLFELGITLFY